MVMQKRNAAPDVIQSLQEKITARNEVYNRIKLANAEVSAAERTLSEKKRLAESAARTVGDFKVFLADKYHCTHMNIDFNAAERTGHDYRHHLHERFCSTEEKEHLSALAEKAAAASSDIYLASESLEISRKKAMVALGEVSKLADPLSEVLSFQELVRNTERNVSSLQAAISEQERLINKANAEIPSLDDLMQRRQDLLAEIATGNDVSGELKALDKEIASQHQKVASAKEIASTTAENAGHTIAGLQRKLAGVQEELKELIAQKQGLLLGFLSYEAEKAGAEYNQLAGSLVRRLRQLIALDSIVSKAGGGEFFGGAQPFVIPSFDLQSCKNESAKEWHPHNEDEDLFFAIHYRGLAEVDYEDELKRIADLGVVL